jgi:DNA-binding beta-propeller fold protein YncE
MFSLHNYDLRLAKQRGLEYIDVLADWQGVPDANWNIGDAYGSVVVDGFLYVAIANTFPGVIKKIDLETGDVVATITLSAVDPRGLCLSFDRRYIYCANYDLNGPGNTVSKIDLATDSEVALITVGSKPGMLDIDIEGNIWVACFGSTSAYIIDKDTDAVSAVALGITPRAVCYDNRGYMYFASTNTAVIKRVRTTTKAISTLAMPTAPYGLCSAADAVIATGFSSSLYKINRTSLGIATIASPKSPTRRPGFDGRRVWVPCGESGFIVVIDSCTNEFICSIDTGSSACKFVCFDSDNAYVSIATGIVRVPLI